MRGFRFSISGLMAWVVVLGVVFGFARWMLQTGLRYFGPDVGGLLFFGVLPMATILAFGLLPLLGSRSGRRVNHSRLMGFEVFGGLALLMFIVAAFVASRPIHDGLEAILRALSLYRSPFLLVVVVAVLLMPQLAVAMLGARWGGKYRIRVSISIERRQESGLRSDETLLTDEAV